MAGDRIEINVVVNGEEQLRNLSVSLRSIILQQTGLIKSTTVLDARQRALNAALGHTGRSFNEHAKTLRQAASNQAVLSREIQQTTAELKKLKTIAATGGAKSLTGISPKDIDNLEKTNKALKSIRARAFVSDLRSVGQEMKRLGKDAQFVGRSLIIGLTTPIVAFGRLGVQNFAAVDKALVRLEKLLNRNRNQFNELTKAVTDFSYEFGIAKELLISVAGDFAELGINSEKVLANLTDLTAQFTILGDMDVSAAQNLTQTLYLGSLRAMEMSGEAARLGDTLKIQEQAVKNVNAQMYIYNALENATALSMREIADTLPEVSAAGLVFGLNFTEMMALLAPMKAVGIDVSAAATGLKVSFQKLVNPTIKLQKELKQLQQDALSAGDIALAFDYENVVGAGMDSIQSLIDITDELMKSTAGGEGALQFYSKLFDDRQATRMLITMQDLANFQNGMFADSAGNAARAQGELVAMINKSLTGTGLYIKDIQTLSEVTALANAKMADGVDTMFLQTLNREVTRSEIEAAKKARKEFGDYVVAQQKTGRDVIEEVTSEAGKAMLIGFAGNVSAMSRAEAELQKAKDSVSMSIDRIKIAFKNLTSTFIEALGPSIKSLADKFQGFVQSIQNLSPETKKMIAAVLAVVAALGPLVFIFGQVRLAGGVLLEGLMRLVPGLKVLSIEQVASASKLQYLSKGLTMQGKTIVNTNSRFATFIATLASGNGPIGKIATKFGELTGMLRKTTTASDDVAAALASVSSTGSNALKTAVAVSDDAVMAAAATAGTVAPPVMGPLPGRLQLMPGPPVAQQLALPAAGQTSVAGKFAPVRGAKGRFAERMVAATPLGTSNAKIMGELMAGPPIPIQKTKQELQREAAAALKAGKAARRQINKEIIDASVKSERKRIRRLSRISQSIRPFDPRGASFTDQLFSNIGTGGAPGQAGRIFTDRAIAAEKIRTQTRPRKALRSILRRGPVAGFMPGAVGAALPFEDEITTGFMQRKFTGRRPTDRLARAPRVARQFIGKGLDAIDKPLNKFADASVLAANRAKAAIGKGLSSAATTGKSSLTMLAGRAQLAGATIGGKISQASAFAGSSIKSFGGKAKANLLSLGTSVGGVVKSFFNLDKVMKIVKMTMMASGIGILVLGIAAAVMLVVKNFDKIRTAAEPGLKMLKEAFGTLISIGKALVAPFIDFFAAMGGSDKGASKVNDVANAFNKIATFINIAAKAVQSFVNKYVVPFLYKALTAVMNIIKGIAKFIQGVIKLKDNWKEGLKMMWEGLKKIGGAILGFFASTVIRGLVMITAKGIQLIISAFFGLARGIVNILRAAVKLSINILFSIGKANINVIDFILTTFALLPRGIGNAVEAAANIFADFVDKIVEGVRSTPLFGWLLDKAGVIGLGKSAANIIRNVGRTVGEAGRATADFVSGLIDPLRNIYQNIQNSILDGVDAGADAINNVISGIANGINDAIGEGADVIGDWLGGLGGNEIGIGAGRDFANGAGEGAEEALDDGALDDPMTDAGGEAGAAAGEEAGKEFADKLMGVIKDLKQQFVDLVLDSVKGALDEATDQLQDALEKQKEAALAVYDTQLKAIDALEKAEESLTKEKEYQTNRRRIIDERELQRQNYQRNRALAIYEGRIDDARMLSLEDQKNQIDFQDNITKTDEDRRKDLVQENLDYLKESIKNAQEETAKMLEEQIAMFEKAAKEITKFPPLTIEEYESQLTQLNDAAKKIAGENGNILKAMMTKMKDNLKMPNENVGVFMTGLDQLIKVAKDKYGLTSTTADNTIIGATIGMLAGIEGQIVGNTADITASFQGIVDNVFDVASGFENISTEIISPALDAMEKIFQEKNPMKVFEQAIKDANETILREMQRTVGHVASLVDDLANMIDDALLKLAALQAAVEEGASGGGSGGGNNGGGGGNNGSTPPNNPPNNPPISLPDPKQLIINAVNQAFSSGIGNFLKIEEKNYLKQFTIDSLTRSFREPGFGMAHYHTLQKNATNPIGKVALQLWEFASKKLGLPVGGASLSGVILGPGVTPSMAASIVNLPPGTDLTNPANVPSMTSPTGRFFGGRIPRFALGGMVPGFASQGVPAILHGGEYVVNAKAVRNIGYAALEAMNGMRYATPRGVNTPISTTVNETQNVNIYVDTFVGEQQWFESMMKQYNLKVVPRNQKAAGVQSRTVSSYNGLNRGM